jgi:hypothetical protein
MILVTAFLAGIAGAWFLGLRMGHRRAHRRALADGLVRGAWSQRAHDVWAIRNGLQPGIVYSAIADEYSDNVGEPWPWQRLTRDGPPWPVRVTKFQHDKVSVN